MEFEWDPRKDAANRRKHGVGFREAATVFGESARHNLSGYRPFDLGASLFDHRRISKRSLVSRGPHRERRHHPADQCTTGYTAREKIL